MERKQQTNKNPQGEIFSLEYVGESQVEGEEGLVNTLVIVNGEPTKIRRSLDDKTPQKKEEPDEGSGS
jgi:hypothetical protein